MHKIPLHPKAYISGKNFHLYIVATSPENGIALTPFCGSVTTDVADMKHGRKFVGIDNKKEYRLDMVAS